MIAVYQTSLKNIYSAENNVESVSIYADYAYILKKFVDKNSMVNYKGLKKARTKLDSFVSKIEELKDEEYSKWNDESKISFWINVYNALTLRAIIDNYPINASAIRSLKYPKNSIRQIPGVWDKIKFIVMGKPVTLNEIEHKILRKKFKEPRIHMALVCAAIGCPILRNKPYIGNNLEKQLNDQTRKFISDSNKFKIDRKKRILYLSPIFKWFSGDFMEKYGTSKKFRNYKKNERAILNFVSNYLSKDKINLFLENKYKIKYLKYDWTLNE